jgi:tetratricopeptide (TPR) repeat protein
MNGPAESHLLQDGFPLSGRLVDRQSGLGLAGVEIDISVPSTEVPAPRARGPAVRCACAPPTLGRAVTAASGSFETVVSIAPEWRQDGVVSLPFPALRLVARSSAGRSYGSFDVPVDQRFEPLRLEVALPRKSVTAALWRELGRHLESARIARLHEVAQQLTRATDGASIFADWDLETRHALLSALEVSFLDPSGVLREHGITPLFRDLHAPGGLDAAATRLGAARRKVAVEKAFTLMSAKAETFASLLSVDWVVDPGAFKRGDPGAGVTTFQDIYTPADGWITVSPGLEGLHISLIQAATDPSRYRDYLRTIYTGPTGGAGYVAALKKLEGRFHQGFQTLDEQDQAANEVLIPILTAILKAPTGAGYGFGVAASAIQARGNRTPREYLDYLVGLTKVSADELRRRYRLDFSRPDSARSSPVRENIAALQGFFADGFQSHDPHPIWGQKLEGHAPFFLQYDEWLGVNGPFHGENHYQIKESFRVNIAQVQRTYYEDRADSFKGKKQEWVVDFILAENRMREGYAHYSQGQFQMAREAYDAADDLAKQAFVKAMQEALGKKTTLTGTNVIARVAERLEIVKLLPVNGLKDVAAYTDAWTPPYFSGEDPITMYSDFDKWMEYSRKRLEVALLHGLLFVLPVLKGDLALAAGDHLGAVQQYEKTTRFLMARADLLDTEGYDPGAGAGPVLVPTVESKPYSARLYHKDGPLPYTTPGHESQDSINYYEGWASPDWRAQTAAIFAKDYLHPMEKRFLRLRHGQALLDWADTLYRADTPADIARAREVYKAALLLLGEAPDIHATWPGLSSWWPSFFFLNESENPAATSQKTRARLAFYQIQSGLNYYGLSDGFVPSLRYRPLKDAADRLAATAKAAQQDFLVYLEKVEDAIRDGLVQSSMLKKAELQAQIAGEQVKLAQFGVQLADNQVKEVEKAIAAKKKEIEDSGDLFNQFKDFVGGMKDAITDLPEGLTSFGSQGAQTAAGVELTKGATLTGASAGAGAMAGYGLFVYAGYTSLSSMADKATSLQQQLNTLVTQVLPLARAQREARKREVKIAQLSQQIARADADLALSILKFQSVRFLNTEFWAHLASVMRRVMERFLSLGARFGWMAERALAYEHHRPLNIIRFDYFPKKLQGVTGADLLQLDLAGVEAARLEGVRQTIPVRRTFSLAFDFPLEFAKLKSTGACTFATEELPFRLAYPGTYGYRIRAVSAKVSGLSPIAPARGLLSNQGASLISRADGTTSLSLRTAEAMPLSEFQLEKDMAVHGLPDEALLLFEGSGIETLWKLEFPAAANPGGMRGVADIQITFDLRAQYAPELAGKDPAPKTSRRYVFLSGGSLDPGALAALRKDGAATFHLDVAAARLPMAEKNRKVTNALVFLAAPKAIAASVAVKTATGGAPVSVVLDNNLAVSNLPPFVSSAPLPPSPLNGLAGRPVDQVFTVDVTTTAPAVLDGVKDVVLGIEYTATL